MPWNGKLIFDNGKELTITTGADSLWGEARLRIALSKEDLEGLSNEELITILRDFQEDADEIALIGLADEVHWDRQYLSGMDLLTIIHSKFATEEQKQKADDILNGKYTKTQTPAQQYKKKKKNPGFVYLFRDIDYDNHYKIGMSQNPNRRLKQIGNATMVCYFPSDDMTEAELKLHKIYDAQRTSGEWFILYDPNVEFIQSIQEYKNGEFLTTEIDNER